MVVTPSGAPVVHNVALHQPAPGHIVQKVTAHSNLAIGGQGANVRNATSNMGGQSGSQGGGGAAGGQAINQPPTFQRLKVEDALSHLDQVKFKFGNQPIES